MNQSSMMIRVEVAAFQLKGNFEFRILLSVGESIDAVVSLLSQEYPEIRRER